MSITTIIAATIAAPAAALALAGIASADTDSLGSIGDTNLGASLGTDGYSVSLGGNTLTSEGWPKSTTTLTGMGYAYTATTDYNYEGGISHTSSLTSPTLSFTNQFEVTPMEGLSQSADIRAGSTEIHCTQFVSCSVGGSG